MTKSNGISPADVLPADDQGQPGSADGLPALGQPQFDGMAQAPQVVLRTHRRRWLLRAAIVCLCLGIVSVVALRRLPGAAPVPAPPALSGTLPIDVAPQARVGDTLIVTIGPAAAKDGTPATLVLQGSYGPRIYRTVFTNGLAFVIIPGNDTRQSGMATLIARAGGASGQALVMLEPDTPVDPVTPLVGARSIIADTQHWSMGVAVPFDQYGNPVADGTPVDIYALHPGDLLEHQQVEVRNLVAWARIFSRTRAGRTVVTMVAAGKHGPEATFVETPGWPVPFSISASPPGAPADGRQFVTLRTDVIRDRYGNAMLDGTLVTFLVETPQGTPRRIPAYTIDGVAKALLQSPQRPGELTIHAVVHTAESSSLRLTFVEGLALTSFVVEASVRAAEQVIKLRAGPLLGAQQQFIPDGTPVAFVLTDPTGEQTWVSAVSEGGYAQAVVRPAFLQLGVYTADVTVGAEQSRLTFQVP